MNPYLQPVARLLSQGANQLPAADKRETRFELPEVSEEGREMPLAMSASPLLSYAFAKTSKIFQVVPQCSMLLALIASSFENFVLYLY